jgi:hypothetical protein
MRLILVLLLVLPAFSDSLGTSFQASPSVISSGQSSTLTWSTTGATSVSISSLGPQALSGSLVVSPATKTIYTLTASNAEGSATATVTVSVQAPTLSITSVLPPLIFSAGVLSVPLPPVPSPAVKVAPPLVIDPVSGMISCPKCVLLNSSGGIDLAGSISTGLGSTKPGQFALKDASGQFWYFCVTNSGIFPMKGSSVPCAP